MLTMKLKRVAEPGSSLNGLIETMPYDEKLDVGFYELNSDGAVSLPLFVSK